MSLSDITNKIQQDAEAQAKIILSDAENTKKNIERDVDRRKEQLQAEHQSGVARRLAANEERTREDARRAGRQYVDTKKRAVIDNVFKKAYEGLISLSSDEYTRVIATLLGGISGDLGKVVVYAPVDRNEETKSVFAKAKVDADIKEDRGIAGGFRIEGEGFEYDLSFQKLMDKKRDELEIAVANMLFD